MHVAFFLGKANPTEFYHSWNRNINPNSPESWEPLTRCFILFKTMLVPVCTRIDRQIFFSVSDKQHQTVTKSSII